MVNSNLFNWRMCSRARVVHIMQSSLGSHLGRNVEAYIDDIVVKTRYKDSLIQDLHETFENLRRVNFKLNPDKCVFGVPSGKLLGFLVSHRGIEANLDKIQAIERMEAPRRVKNVQHINGWITAQEIGSRAIDLGS